MDGRKSLKNRVAELDGLFPPIFSLRLRRLRRQLGTARLGMAPDLSATGHPMRKEEKGPGSSERPEHHHQSLMLAAKALCKEGKLDYAYNQPCIDS